MEKKSTLWTVVKILLAVGAVCAVAAVVYHKFFRKKKEEELLEEAEELEALDIAEELIDDEPPFEASAEAVIANAEEMEESVPEAEA
ncbi:MAG: hypothetical protein II369_04470 [Clostridia bacterium]|nr:hypothetical protein [Clostridia bacterium]MBQ1963355.1 hypothetical protein [Clostridia bacterium]